MLLVAVCSPAFSQTLPQNDDCTEIEDNASPLNADQVFTRTIKANQRHIFRLSLTPQQYVHVVADQKGVDLEVTLLDPNKELLIERDSPNSKFGPEAVSTIAQSGGTYYLDICANKSQPVGSYELKVEGPRQSTPADEKRVSAERMLMEGQQKKRESRALAIEQFKEAASIFHDLGETREEGYALCNIGETFRSLEDFPAAMKHLDQALELLVQAHDLSGQSYVLNEMGAAYRDLDDPSKAVEKYERAIELRTSLADRWGEALLRNNLGVVYTQIGEQQKALDHLELALSTWREFHDRAMEMNTLNIIAKANLDLGNLTVAFQQSQEVLNYCEVNGSYGLEPHARTNLGVAYDTWGEPNDALSQYDLALKRFRQNGNKKYEVNTLNNIGMVYAGIGDGLEALAKFQEALNVRSKPATFREEAVTRSNIGFAYMLLEKYPAALKELDLARRLSQKFHDPRFEAYSLVRIGMAYVALRRMAPAIVAYNQALDIQNRIKDRRGQAITLDRLGEYYSLLNQPDLAIKNYRDALQRWGSLKDAQGEALSLYGIARVERNQKHLTDARDDIVEALKKVESIRTRMTSHRLRTSYYAAKQDFFELEIDIRMRLYSATNSKAEMESALYASERARARNLLDLLAESRTDIRQGVDPQLLALERTQREQLDDKLKQYQTISSANSKEAQRAAADKEILALLSTFDQTQAEIRKSSSRYAALTQPQPLKPDQMQQLLDDDTLLLEYALGEKQSYLWVVSKNDVHPYVLPGRAQIENAAQNFHKSLRAWERQRPNEDVRTFIARRNTAPQNYRRRALELSNIVLAPVSSQIAKKRLVILADGALQYVPFGALPASSSASDPEPLIVNHEIVYQPSASALALIREAPRPAATKTVAVLADPVFSKNDERVITAKESKTEPTSSHEFKRAMRDAGDIGSVDGSFRLDRLEFTRSEADAIIAAAPPGSSMQALDFDASRTRVLSPELKQYRILHLATHGILNGNHPELSGLVFSLVDQHGQTEDGFLKLNDIYNMDLPLDMIVLSACETGLGKQVRGEGLIGLTRGFMHAGAARVVASLWKVDDEATAQLMKGFYSYLLEKKMPAAAALRLAQLDLRKTRSEPYAWAGFVLQGEWK
ncbi:MAG TPA: CHAT domain-containing tetratricopeptide repeat protein [Pyrinomonadaceae bacterium]|nr:CHAT domain-containing tetratricopeptide repeat protein [Pyrinomonadaceae bacterium]